MESVVLLSGGVDSSTCLAIALSTRQPTEAATRMSTTRTDEQLDAARDVLVAWVQRMRAGDFAATPSSSQCWRCDYGPLCPERVR